MAPVETSKAIQKKLARANLYIAYSNIRLGDFSDMLIALFLNY